MDEKSEYSKSCCSCRGKKNGTESSSISCETQDDKSLGRPFYIKKFQPEMRGI